MSEPTYISFCGDICSQCPRYSATITNNGLGDVVQAPYELTVTGGLLGLINKTIDGTMDLEAGATENLFSGLLFGFGGIEVTITIGAKEEIIEGIQLLIFTLV